MCVDAFRSWLGEPGGPPPLLHVRTLCSCGLFSPNIGHRPLSRPRFRTKCPAYLHCTYATRHGPSGLSLLPPKLEREPLDTTSAYK
ncbi:hypothetical protein CGRA01v4_06705 [Colletotrichum graminicola]|nr:hypothetical protein CGRA01v4_06705 [Colletotrichum graminicola]